MMARQSVKVAVIGAGAWGTALAVHLARVGHEVRLWGHRPEAMRTLDQARQNQRYLPGIAFPDTLKVEVELAEALQGVSAVLVVVPSHVFRSQLRQLRGFWQDFDALPHFAWATKGFEPDSQLLLHKVARQELGESASMTVLSGPTFAAEVAKGLPTAMVSASKNSHEAEFWAQLFHHDRFRMYTQDDMVGVEIGGAYKNIMAIATGVSDGLGLGANARAALISRGMAEMMRLSHALGGQSETMMGLAGLGDLVLTCTDDLSRNRRFGYKLAKAESGVDRVIAEIGQVVEGVKAVQAVKMLAEELKLDLPIMEQVHALVTESVRPLQAVDALLARSGKAEALQL